MLRGVVHQLHLVQLYWDLGQGLCVGVVEVLHAFIAVIMIVIILFGKSN